MNSHLQMLVRNWVLKAEHDLKIGQDELKTDQPATDMVCFHMQQCVEIDPQFETLFQVGADTLTIYGIEVRYPDEFYMPIRSNHFCNDVLQVGGW